MPISFGTRLGPYEILSPLGVGGMGEVYRARDPRMGREVAIKISAERFSDRFEREVRAVAALNHPNICQVYDVGPNYLVMELVEGPTLADRIRQGAIPLDEALPIARQIAEALEAAHEKGIVHRDLKLANIKIKPDGAVKVLDFGLAKMAEAAATASNPDESPTVPMGATLVGQILGTAAYMAPEQARGKTVDKRADIWSFGVVLYEMLSGRRLFEGETISDTLAAVLTKEPEFAGVPPKARRLLQRCLERDPKRRLRDIGDAWALLDERTDAPAAPAPKSAMRWKVAYGVFGLVLGLALGALWRGPRPSQSVPSAGRVDLDLGPDVSFGSTTGPAVILSPDGTRLVFVSQDQNGVPRLFTRRLDQPKAIQMPGTEGAYAPFFAPDGQWVGFFAEGKLKKMRLEGGDPIPLCDAPAGRGGSWGEDGNIIAALDQQAGLSLIPAEGGAPVAVTQLNLDLGETTHRWPQVLPGGRAVVFLVSDAYGYYDDADIAVVSLKDHRRKVILEHAGMYPRYVGSGHLLYVTKGTLFVRPFDSERLEVKGAAAPLGEVASNPNLGYGQFDLSRDGTFAYRTAGAEGLKSIQWLDSTGKMTPLGIPPAYYQYPALSPDGTHLVYTLSQASSSQSLWIYDFERGSSNRLTSDTDSWPVWSPDGRFVVFQARGGIYWTRADGAGKPRRLVESKAIQLPTSLAAGGKRMAYSQMLPGAEGEIRTVAVESSSDELRLTGEPQVFLKTATGTAFATFSPDGRWLAYANAAGGRYEVFVRAFPDNGTQAQISNAGGVMPEWSRKGRELFYRTLDQRIMVADYTEEGGRFVVHQKPRTWSGKTLANTGLGRNFDLAPDGKRFVVLMPAEGPEPRATQSHVMIVANFFDEVRRRVAGQVK